MFQSGEFRARQHGGNARREVQHGGHFAQLPQREHDHRRGVDIGQQEADAFATRNFFAQSLSQHIRTDHQLATGERLQRRVFEDDLTGALAGGLRHGGEDVLRAELHLDLELLPHHLIAEPVGQHRACAACADFAQLGRSKDGAEMRGDLWE